MANLGGFMTTTDLNRKLWVISLKRKSGRRLLVRLMVGDFRRVPVSRSKSCVAFVLF